MTIDYDLAGRLLSASTPLVSNNPASGQFSRSYDTAGRLITEQSPKQTSPVAYDSLAFELDHNGNVTKITYPSGYTVSRSYDLLNRVTNIYLNGSTFYAASFTYDGLDRRTNLSLNSGTDIAYSFDIANNRLSTEIAKGTTALVNLNYMYNNVNQMIDKKTSDVTYEWQPSVSTNVKYASANVLNAYPKVNNIVQSYDLAGRLIADGTYTYIYNTEGMLTQVKSGSTVVATFTYDPFKRLVLKYVAVTNTTTRYVYSGSQLMEEYNCSGVTPGAVSLPGILIRRYVYASPGEAIFQIDANNNVTYLLNDHQGSLIAQTDATALCLISTLTRRSVKIPACPDP